VLGTVLTFCLASVASPAQAAAAPPDAAAVTDDQGDNSDLFAVIDESAPEAVAAPQGDNSDLFAVIDEPAPEAVAAPQAAAPEATAASSVNIWPLAYTRVVSGSFEAKDDRASFRLEVPFNGEWSFQSAVDVGDTTTDLLDEHGNRIASSSSHFPLSRTLQAGVIYYLVISPFINFLNLPPWTGARSYTITATVVPIVLSHTQWQAHSTVGSLQVDVTSFGGPWTAQSDSGWLTVDRANGIGDATLTVSVEANADPVSRTGVITVTANGATATLRVVQAEYIEDDHGDDIASATPWPLATQQVVSGSLEVNYDRDFFRLDVPLSVIWRIESVGTGDVEAYLYDKNGNRLAYDDNDGPGLNFQFLYQLQAGTYYLEIGNRYQSTSDTGPYTITATAEPIVLSRTLWKARSKVDSLQVDVYAFVTPWTAQSDSGWLTVDRANGTGDATLTVSVEANVDPAPRTGVVTVTGDGGTATLSVTQAAAPEADDHGGDIASATLWPLASQQVMSGSLEVEEDWDFFQLDVPISGQWVFTSAGTGDVFGHLYNSSGTQLTYDDEGGGMRNFRVAYDLAAGTTYYLAIRNYSATTSNTGPYTITATAPAPMGLSSTQWAPPATAATTSVTVYTLGPDWTASSDASWLTVTPAAGANEDVVTVEVAANTVGSPRSGTVTFSSEGATATLEVTQAASDGHGSTIDTATPWPLATQLTMTGSLEVGADVDFFQLDVPITGHWVFTSAATGNVYGILHDSSGEYLTTDNNGGGGLDFRVGHTLTAGTTYYLSIRNYSATTTDTGPYTITATAPEPVSLSSTQWAPTAEAAGTFVTVYTRGPAWTASSDASWLTVTPATGVSEDEVTVEVAANAVGSPRSGTVTFSGYGSTATLEVTQAAFIDDHGSTIDTATPWPLATQLTMTGSLEVREDRDYFRLEVPFSGEWVFTSAGSWNEVGTLYDSSGSQLTSDHSGYDFRIAYTLTAGTTYYLSIRNYSVTQPVTGPYTITAAAPEPVVSLSSTQWAPAAAAATTSVTVHTRGPDWTASSDTSWLTVRPATGADGDTATVEVAANPVGSPRSGTVTFSSEGATATLEVTQAAFIDDHGSTIETATPWPLATQLSVTGSLELAADWDFFRLDVPFSGEWSFESDGTGDVSGYLYDETGALIDSDDNGGPGNGFLVAHALEAGVAYHLAIANYDESTGATGPYTITAQAPALTRIAVSPSEWSPAAAAATTQVAVTMQYPSWTAGSDADWLTISPDTGANGATPTVSVTENTSTQPRWGEITFADGVDLATLSVAQAGISDDHGSSIETASPWPLATQTVMSGSLESGDDWDFFRLDVPSSGQWLFTSSGAGDVYGHLYNSGGTQLTSNGDDGDHNFRISYDLTSGTTYYLAIRNSYSATTDTGAYTITATPPRPTVSLSVDAWSPAAAGGATTVVVTTDQPGWTASSDAVWLTVSPASGVSGDQISVTAGSNSGAARTGVVTVAAGGTTATVTVAQAAFVTVDDHGDDIASATPGRWPARPWCRGRSRSATTGTSSRSRRRTPGPTGSSPIRRRATSMGCCTTPRASACGTTTTPVPARTSASPSR
jgi:hypothetical protein